MNTHLIHKAHETSFSSKSFVKSCVSFAQMITKPFARFFRARQAVAHLQSLNDIMLADIGITRWEIKGAVSRGNNCFDTGGRV